MKDNFILLVEDNPSDINLTRRAFEKNKIRQELVVVQDGQEALDYLFGRGGYAGRDIVRLPAVIWLDLNLPRLDGLSVLRRIRAEEKTRLVPVVVLTTSNERWDREACYTLGANSYVRKPIDFLKFTEAVAQLESYWLSLNQPPVHASV